MLKQTWVALFCFTCACAFALPNPASVYCEELGGQLEMISHKNGVSGICILPNGEEVDEWELYRRDMTLQEKDPEAYAAYRKDLEGRIKEQNLNHEKMK